MRAGLKLFLIIVGVSLSSCIFLKKEQKIDAVVKAPIISKQSNFKIIDSLKLEIVKKNRLLVLEYKKNWQLNSLGSKQTRAKYINQ